MEDLKMKPATTGVKKTMMETLMNQIYWTLFTVFLQGVFAGDWSINVPSSPICTMIGSTVVLPCSYDFPQSRDGQQYNVKSEMWCLGESRCITPRYVYHSAGILQEPSFQDRVEYLGKQGSKNCSLKISSLRESDSGAYVFYLITNHTTEKMPAQRGLQLLVAGSPSAVSVLAGPSSDITEGEFVTLSCCSSEASSDSRVKWFKSSSSEPQHSGPVWTISKATSADSGSYYCQVQTKDKVQTSKQLALDVQYSPRNTVITESPPEETGAGRPVTLSCSSDANPPVLTYTWYKGAACDPGADTSFYKAVQSYASATRGGPTLSSINITADERGVHCCEARNRHGSQKFTVKLNTGTSNTGSRMVILGVTIAVLALIAIILIVIKRRKKSSRNQSYSFAATSSSER